MLKLTKSGKVKHNHIKEILNLSEPEMSCILSIHAKSNIEYEQAFNSIYKDAIVLLKEKGLIEEV